MTYPLYKQLAGAIALWCLVPFVLAWVLFETYVMRRTKWWYGDDA